MYIDSHAHLSSDELFKEFDPIRQRARGAGVDKIVNICTDAVTLERGLLLRERDPDLFLAASPTTHDGEEATPFFVDVEREAKRGTLVAVGETGLDYHYEHADRAVQKKHLLQAISLARETSLPLIFHCREAFADLFDIVSAEYGPGPALIHCFTGTGEEAARALDLGWFLSFSGIVTFKKSDALREVVRDIPLDRILVETDSPYLAPASKRGKVNEPSFLPETVATIAAVKGISVEPAAAQIKANTLSFFSF